MGTSVVQDPPLAQELDYPPLVTLDTDVAVPNRLPAGAANIAKRLREYDFNEDLLGDHQPPVTQYKLGSEDTGFYAEFLTPLTGSGYKRDDARHHRPSSWREFAKAPIP